MGCLPLLTLAVSVFTEPSSCCMKKEVHCSGGWERHRDTPPIVSPTRPALQKTQQAIFRTYSDKHNRLARLRLHRTMRWWLWTGRTGGCYDDPPWITMGLCHPLSPMNQVRRPPNVPPIQSEYWYNIPRLNCFLRQFPKKSHIGNLT